MSYSTVPARMLAYATHELAELLAALTPAQRAAIDRIVEHVYINNRPWAILFVNQPEIPPCAEFPLGRPAIPRICAETNYYRRGRYDPETDTTKGAGWAHDPAFKEALDRAKELALATREEERSRKLQAAKRRAEDNAELAVNQWVSIMQSSRVDFARIEAAGKVLELAFRGEGDTQSSGRELERDWWQAAEGNSE